MSAGSWPSHVLRLGDLRFSANDVATSGGAPAPADVESWIGAILQTDHLSLLLGNGFTTAQTLLAGGEPASMDQAVDLKDPDLQEAVETEASRVASDAGRGAPNIEDRLRAALALEPGLRICDPEGADDLGEAVTQTLTELCHAVLQAEKSIKGGAAVIPDDTVGELTANGYLVSFLLAFASRAPTRDRLGIFTTNYDRLVEYACDVAGLRILDRFIGNLNPEFRSSRLDVDLHYNPPGIRGEPRYLDGVVRLTKLHGSIDWQWRDRSIVREAVPFGGAEGAGWTPSDRPIIYPNAAKDFETAYYPYADLFRDFSAAVCRPNSVLVTYGYGFGDDHINRVIADMLTLPSAHLLVISYDSARGRIERFVGEHGREGQVSVVMGTHFGRLATLVDDVLPSPATDTISWRRARLLRDDAPKAEGSGGESD